MSIPCGARDGTALTQRRYRRLSRCANHRPYARGPNGENALRSLPDVALLPSRANLGTPAADPSTSGREFGCPSPIRFGAFGED